jgi:hypothetical protein
MQVQQLREPSIGWAAPVSQWFNHLVGYLGADSCPQSPVPATSRLECCWHGLHAMVPEAGSRHVCQSGLGAGTLCNNKDDDALMADTNVAGMNLVLHFSMSEAAAGSISW